MKKQIEEIRAYVSPKIEFIKLDNEISLVLESTPPVGPEEGSLQIKDYFNSNPYAQLV